MSERSISAWAVVNLGVLLAVMYVGATLPDILSGTRSGVIAVQLLIGVLLPIVLVGAGVWLGKTDLSQELRWKIAVWSFGGLTILTAVTGWGLYLRLFTDPDIGNLLKTFILNAQAGALAGFAVGVYNTRADRRERKLEELNTRLELALEETDTGVWEWDLKTDEVFWDEASEQLFGYEPGEFPEMYEGFTNRVLDEDIKEVERRVNKAIETGDRYQADFRIETSERGQRWIQSRGIVEYDENGDAEQMFGIQTDITERKRRERELEELATRLELALESTTTGVWEWDLQTDEVIWDEQMEKLFGYEPGGFPGKYEGFSERVHPDDLPMVERAHERGMEEGYYASEFRVFVDGETVRWVKARAEVFYEDGEATRMVGIVTDITERKEREQELETYEAFIENSSDELMHISESGTLLYESPVPESPLGYETGEQVGDNVFEYIHPEDRETALEGFYNLLNDPERKTTKIRLRIKSADGEYIWTEVTGADQTDTDMGGVIISLREISQQVEREEELRETKRKLEQSNEQLEQFAYAVSHDLQEPLRMVSSYLELLSDEYEDELDDEASEYIEFAIDGAERMREMIEGLLEYSRIESNNRRSGEVDVEEVLDDILRDLELLIDRENATVSYDSLPAIEGDKGQIRQLFQNLIKNGIEHAGDEPPEVRVEANEHDEQYEFLIEDNGVGIPEEEQEEVFEMFAQGSHEGGGTGMGLAICNRIVEKHGGEMALRSDECEGSTFFLTFPK